MSPQHAFFANFLHMPRRVPMWVWHLARGLASTATLAVIGLLVGDPETGTRIFWGLLVPILPALFVIAPGLWRQVCPLVVVNQLPRATGTSLALDLPQVLRTCASVVATGLLILGVGMRGPALDHDGYTLGLGLLTLLGIAFLGGLLFEGRAGWCGTFCPVGPVEKIYGHAPLILIRNSYCRTCVDCQNSCYSFDPRSYLFNTFAIGARPHARLEHFGFGILPGLILAYYLLGSTLATSPCTHLYIVVAACMISTGLYSFALHALPLAPYRSANLFAAIAIATYYYFSLPVVLHTCADLAGCELPAALVAGLHPLCLFPAATLLIQGSRSIAHHKALHARESASVARARAASTAPGPDRVAKSR